TATERRQEELGNGGERFGVEHVTAAALQSEHSVVSTHLMDELDLFYEDSRHISNTRLLC
ncbi:hypothetical protein INR49_000101, partial [Caranx melampygus]